MSDRIHQDQYGVLRVAKTRISLDSVVLAFLQGHSAATVQEQYPGLTLQEVEAAIEYYLANRVQVDQYLRDQAEVWRCLRQESEKHPAPVVDRLRAMRMSEAQP